MTDQEAQEFLLNLLNKIQLTHESTRQVARSCETTQRSIQKIVDEAERAMARLSERIETLTPIPAPCPTAPQSNSAFLTRRRRLAFITAATLFAFLGGTVFASVGIADGTNLDTFAVWSRIFGL